jgi:hypothetical protein
MIGDEEEEADFDWGESAQTVFSLSFLFFAPFALSFSIPICIHLLLLISSQFRSSPFALFLRRMKLGFQLMMFDGLSRLSEELEQYYEGTCSRKRN